MSNSDSDSSPPSPPKKYRRIVTLEDSSDEDDSPNSTTLPYVPPKTANGHIDINEAETQILVRNGNGIHDQTTLLITNFNDEDDESMIQGDVDGVRSGTRVNQPSTSTPYISTQSASESGFPNPGAQPFGESKKQDGVVTPEVDVDMNEDTTIHCGRCGVSFYENCPCDDDLMAEANNLDPHQTEPGVTVREDDDHDGDHDDVDEEDTVEVEEEEDEEEDDGDNINEEVPEEDDDSFELNNEEIQEDLGDVPEITPAQPVPDSLENIQFVELDTAYASVPVAAEMKIHNPFEISLHFYKLSFQQRQIPYVPSEFVELIRDNEHLISRYYVPETRMFIFPLTVATHSTLMGILTSIGVEMEAKISMEAIRALSAYRPLNLKNREFPHPQLAEFFNSPLMTGLNVYQQETVQRLICLRGRGLIAYEEGMGERFPAIAAGIFYEKEWPLLIVCAAARIEEWGKELLDRAGVEEDQIKLIPHSNLSEIPSLKLSPKVVVIGYNSLQEEEVAEALKKFRARVLILDESHRIKHFRTKTTQAVLRLAKHARRRFLISATPALGVPRELFFQLHVLDQVTFKNYREFADLYCGIETDENGKDHVSRNWRSAKNLTELQQVLHGTLVIRKFRSAHFKLPTISREIVYLKFQPDLRTRRLLGALCYSESIRSFDYLEHERENEDEQEKKHKTAIFKWFKQSGWAKRIQICQYLDSIDYKENKVIIYARHKGVVKAIEQILEKKGVKHVVIRGGYDKRKELCRQFNSKRSVRVAVASIDLSIFEIDLSGANLLVFTEISWVPDSLSRNENRSYSLTSPRNPSRQIQVKYLLAKDESSQGKDLHIDGVIWDMIGGKMEVLRKLGLKLDEDIFIHDIPEINFRPEPINFVGDLELEEIPSELDSDSEWEEESESDDDDDDDDDENGDGELSQELRELNNNSPEDDVEDVDGADSQEEIVPVEPEPEFDPQESSSEGENSAEIGHGEVASGDEETNESDEHFIVTNSEDDEESEDEDYDPTKRRRRHKKRSSAPPERSRWKEEGESDEESDDYEQAVRKNAKTFFK